MVAGYVVMRVPMIVQWVRAARNDPAHRNLCLLYARTIAAAQTGWVVLALEPLTLWPSIILALLLIGVEVLGPVLVSRMHGGTPWHPHHIAERYGLLIIIALGGRAARDHGHSLGVVRHVRMVARRGPRRVGRGRAHLRDLVVVLPVPQR